MCQPVTTAVSTDNRPYLPPPQFVVELVTADSDLAHKQGKELMDACQFFGFAPLDWLFAFSPTGISKNSATNSITEVYTSVICL